MNDTTPFVLRPIRRGDDPAVAAVIREVMTEHGCTDEGFAIHDAEVEAMTANYRTEDRAAYYVVARKSEVLGGAGFARLAGTTEAEATCELRKMYFRPPARGHGLGHAVLDLLLDEMCLAGYRRCYIETTSWMDAARHVYLAHGFAEIPEALGSTGHGSCDRFFLREL